MSPSLKRIFWSARRHFVLAAREELEVNREVEELLALGVLHDPAGLLVGLDRHALLVPADRLGFLLQAMR